MKIPLLLFLIFGSIFGQFLLTEDYIVDNDDGLINEKGAQQQNTYTDVLLTIDTLTKISIGTMKEDCSDMKFLDYRDPLMFWIESGCGSNTTDVWIRFPRALPSGKTTIHMHYFFEGEMSTLEDVEYFPFDGGSFLSSMLYTSSSCPNGGEFTPPSAPNDFFFNTLQTGNPFIFYDGIGGHDHTVSAVTTIGGPTRQQQVQNGGGAGIDVSTNLHSHTENEFIIHTIQESMNPLPAFYLRACQEDLFHKIKKGQVFMVQNMTYLDGFDGWIPIDPNLKNYFLAVGDPVDNKLLDIISDPKSPGHMHEYTTGKEDYVLMPNAATLNIQSTSGTTCHQSHGHLLNFTLPKNGGQILYTSRSTDDYPRYIGVQFVESVRDDVRLFPGAIMFVKYIFLGTIPPGWESNDELRGKLVRYADADGGRHSHMHAIKRKAGISVVGPKPCAPYSGGIVRMSSHDDHQHNYIRNLNAKENLNHYKFTTHVIMRKKSLPTYLKRGNVTQNTWTCFGVSRDDPKTCSAQGKCVGLDTCLCHKNLRVFGKKCNEIIGHGLYINKNKIAINYTSLIEIIDESYENQEMVDEFSCDLLVQNATDIIGDDKKCKWKAKSILETEFLHIMNVNKDIKELFIKVISKEEYVLVDIAEYIPPNSDFNFDLIVYIAIPCASIILIIVTIILIVLCVLLCCTAQNQKKLKKFGDLDVDVILKEQEAEGDTSIAHLQINKKLFEIDYDKIQIIEKIGAGGSSSIVYKAKYSSMIVAVKTFKVSDVCTSQQRFDGFEKEVGILASLKHPNILRFLGACIKVPRVSIITEFCSLGDLKHFLTEFKENNLRSYEFNEKIRIVTEISSAMLYLHKLNIIHRDLKCENVLIRRDYTSRVMDFGMSKVVTSMSQQKTKRIGTSVYMSPEIVLGKDYTEKTDIFSFGIMLYEIFCDNFDPYSSYGKKTYNLEMRVANDAKFRPKINPKLFKDQMWLITLTKSCWSNSPGKRPSFEEILNSIKSKSKIEEKKIEENEGENVKELEEKLKRLKDEKVNLRSVLDEKNKLIQQLKEGK